MRSQQWKATTMNNNIEVMKSVWRRVQRPSVATLQRIKAKAELEARVTLRYMALLTAVLTMMMMAFAPMVHGQDVRLAVFNHQIMVGMTYGNVLASWGQARGSESLNLHLRSNRAVAVQEQQRVDAGRI
jgi:hypothetical protein